MKKIFEEPAVDFISIRSEAVTEGSPEMSGGQVSDPF